MLVTHADGQLIRGRMLSDYHLVHNSTITICMRVKGGSDRPTRLPGLIDVTYDQPDMISLDDSQSPRAVMPCRHVISECSFSWFVCFHFHSQQMHERTVLLVLLLANDIPRVYLGEVKYWYWPKGDNAPDLSGPGES